MLSGILEIFTRIEKNIHAQAGKNFDL